MESWFFQTIYRNYYAHQHKHTATLSRIKTENKPFQYLTSHSYVPEQSQVLFFATSPLSG